MGKGKKGRTRRVSTESCTEGEDECCSGSGDLATQVINSTIDDENATSSPELRPLGSSNPAQEEKPRRDRRKDAVANSNQPAPMSPSAFKGFIRLNVGGHFFDTSLVTLTKDRDSMLAAMFSERFSLQPSPDGSIFIDRDGTHFRYILNYLRDGSVDVMQDPSALRELCREAQYYGLFDLVEEIGDALDDADSDEEIVKKHDASTSTTLLNSSFEREQILAMLNSGATNATPCPKCSAKKDGKLPEVEVGKTLQLPRISVRGMDLSWLGWGDGSVLAGSDMTETDLSHSRLRRGQLQYATLVSANLTSMDLSGSNLEGADLSHATITSANLQGANLRNVNFISANLCGVMLQGADLTGANLSSANLSGANLSNANCSQCRLRGADLTQANLHGACLEGAR